MTFALVGLIAGVLLAYALFIAALVIVRPADMTLRETMRMLPDLLRLVRRLAADRSVARGARWRLWLLLAYLAMPFDVIPDFIPVVGFADDAIVIVLVLRSVVRRAGPAKIAEHWPGSDAGLRAIGVS